MLTVLRRPAAVSAIAGLVLTATTVLLSPTSSANDVEPENGTRPPGDSSRSSLMATAEATEGLQMVVNERGRISQSTSALGTRSTDDVIHVEKPAGATVRGAWMAYATRGFSGYQVMEGAQPRLNDTPVPLANELLNGISSYNYFADVTSIVKPVVDDAPAGSIAIPLTEPDAYNIEGEILVVVFDDPSVTQDQSVTLLYGALAPGGDSYQVKMARPIDLRDPATKLHMSLGITYSAQANGEGQYSSVSVNNQPLTSSAGGEDDGLPANGALMTVGGVGDSVENPADPLALPVTEADDDELYDLRPFVTTGDTSIRVNTNNPSFDDNVMLATFTMNPPVTDIDGGRDYVVVALGDSYQSGEGAGEAYQDQADYYLHAYENGSNYPQAVGGQEDTLTEDATGGNGCHRALQNYPKQVAGWLADEGDVTLVDVTCSGAKIERGGRPPLVGDLAGGDVDPDSQIRNAQDRLASAGLTAEDVDLVTVGMGGNDAKFSDLVAACLAPTLARRVLAAYDSTPFILNQAAKLLTCKRLDDRVFHVDDAIDTLAAKERFAQTELRTAFPRADIFQVDYPGILPDPDSAPSWCGGISGDDIAYADSQAARINDIIRDTVSEAYDDSAALDRYYNIVEVQHAFGGNALCPADPADALANGIDQANFDREVNRLLTDPSVRPLLDEVTDSYGSLRNCLARLTFFCDPQARTDRLTAALIAVRDRFTSDDAFVKRIQANIVHPYEGTLPETDAQLNARFDRFQQLFHPNQQGIDVLGCYVYGTVTFLGTLGCPNGQSGLRAGFATTAEATGQPITATRVPVPVDGPGAQVALGLTGYAPGTSVEVSHHGEPVATLTAGETGTVTGPLTLPAGPPGVQLFEVRGHTAGGTALGHDLRLTYPGSPRLDQDYTFYVDGFESGPTEQPDRYAPESVSVTYGGIPVGDFDADPQGGVLITLPMPEAWPVGGLDVILRGNRSGVERTVRLDPDGSSAAVGLWATGGDVQIAGARAAVDVLVHGEQSVKLRGADGRYTGGLEYVDDLSAHRSTLITPVPVKVPEGERTRRELKVASYRPGAAEAVAAGAAYRAIPATACVNGTWTPTEADLSGVVYVPCAVSLSSGTIDATVTLAAEGQIAAAVGGAVLRPAARSGAVLLSGEDLHVSGNDVQMQGALAAGGAIKLSGAGQTLFCGAVGRTVSATGADFTVELGGPCAPG